MLVDLKAQRFECDGLGCRVEPCAVLAPVGTHLAECLTCTQLVERARMAEFCYASYRVTGDGERKDGARHPGQVCRGAWARVRPSS